MAKRQDIQALRGIAISLVLLDHAGIRSFEGGFLGVDIFFVISGFLITGNIARALDIGKFRFREFYFKRARRILPASFVAIAMTSVGSIWFMSSFEMAALRDQVLGALTYTSNFVLWKQVDYFAIGSNSKPLLHMWSLAVEEQFYLLLPVLLFLTPRHLRRWVLLALTVVSFGFCRWWVGTDAVGAFYMLPSRAWELGIGGCAALFGNSDRKMPWLCWPGGAALLTIPCSFSGFQHPGWLAAALCIATASIVVANNETVARSLPTRVLARIGDISYSLYLVHWPVMVFAYGAFLGTPPRFVGPINIVISLGLALALYFGVERPAMTLLRRPSWTVFAVAIAATAAVALTYFVSFAIALPRHDWIALRAPNYGFNKLCDYSGKRFVARPQCRNSDQPTTMIWGDSYAMHLVPGAAERQELVQMTSSACAPFLGYAPQRSNIRNPEVWANRCIDFNNDALAYLSTQPSIETVILSSAWRSWVVSGTILLSRDGNKLKPRVSDLQFAIESIGTTIRSIQALGKKVILFSSPPSVGKDYSVCLERQLEGKVLLAGVCSIAIKTALRVDAAANKFLDRSAERYGVQIVRMSDVLCSGRKCITEHNGVPIYRDAGHLSNAGSKIVFELLRSAGKLATIESGGPVRGVPAVRD